MARPSLTDCPAVPEDLLKHLEAVFGRMVKFIPGTPNLGEWAAYQGAFDVLLNYLKGAQYVQRHGAKDIPLHVLEGSEAGPVVPKNFADLQGVTVDSLRNGLLKDGVLDLNKK